MKDPLQIQAAALLDKLTQERGKDILAIPVKERPTTKALLAARLQSLLAGPLSLG